MYSENLLLRCEQTVIVKGYHLRKEAHRVDCLDVKKHRDLTLKSVVFRCVFWIFYIFLVFQDRSNFSTKHSATPLNHGIPVELIPADPHSLYTMEFKPLKNRKT